MYSMGTDNQLPKLAASAWGRAGIHPRELSWLVLYLLLLLLLLEGPAAATAWSPVL